MLPRTLRFLGSIRRIAIFSFCCATLLCSSATANFGEEPAGILTGQVTDAGTGEALPGATVQIVGTAIGAATDLKGNYRIARAPDGAQTVSISFIGYKSQQFPIQIAPGGVTELDASLELDVVEGEEILISAQAEGQIAAINQQLASNTIINVVSGARIEELPDQNAAEAVGRLPGVSLVRNAGEGQKVTVRGLAPQYNTVTVNGRQLPSTSDNRSTDLSMISPDLLDGIELFKAHTSDQDGDYLGGSVNFVLAEAREGLRTDVRMQSGYSSSSTNFGQFKGSAMVSNRILDDKLGIIVQANGESIDRWSDVSSASYRREGESTTEELAPLFINGLNLIDGTEDRRRLGASLLFDYRLPQGGKIKFTNFYSRLDRDRVTRNKNYGVNDRIVSYGVRDQDILTDVLSNEIAGEHNFGALNVAWGVGRAVSVQETPYDNSLSLAERSGFDTDALVETQGPEVIPAAALNRLLETGFGDGNFRTNRLRERDVTANLDLSMPYAFGDKIAGELKLGGKYRSKDRVNDESRQLLPFTFGPGAQAVQDAFPERTWTLARQGFLSMMGIEDPNFDAGEFHRGEYDFGFTPDLDFANEMYNRIGNTYIRSSLAEFDDYQNTENIAAGYVMTELNIGQLLMIMPGVRVEQTSTDYTASQGRITNARQTDAVRNEVNEQRTYTDVLPMIHARIKPADWIDLRLARTETLTRPNHFAYSPRLTIEGNGDRVRRGDPDLEAARSINYDAFLSFKGNRLGLLTFGAFLKRIDGLVYSRDLAILDPEEFGLPDDTRGATLFESINNPLTTDVRGIEVDWQANLTFLPEPLNGLVVNANLALIDSETQYPRSLLKRAASGFGFTRVDTFRVGNMINQAASIANFSAGYDRAGFSGRVSMYLQGESLAGVGSVAENDRFTETYMRWDLSLKQAITSQISLFLNVNNLNNRPDRAFQSADGFSTRQEFYGWTTDMGIRLRY